MKMVQRTLALVSLSVLFLGLSGPGCGPNCTEDQWTLSKESGELSPDFERDCVSVDIPPSSPPPPPPPPPQPSPPVDVSGYFPADLNGPKSPEAAINMLIIVSSCLFGYSKGSLNQKLDNLYFSRSYQPLTQGIRDRTSCFRYKNNACAATAECLGIADWYGEPLPGAPDPFEYETSCDGDTRKVVFSRFTTQTELSLQRRYNCGGMDLHCYEPISSFDNHEPCEWPRTPCNPFDPGEHCVNERPDFCEDQDLSAQTGWEYQEFKCSDYGLTCERQPSSPEEDCVGTGPACELPKDSWARDVAFDYRRGGIACESTTMLRSCIGRYEKLTDCAQLGIGFKCLPGPEPHCGFATECTADAPVTCDGDSLVVCDAGRVRKVDCKTLGFTTCDATRGICGPSIYDQGGTIKFEP